MVRSWRASSFALAVVFLLAGCADAPQTLGVEEISVDPEAPVVAGIVLDAELAPIAGAIVAVDQSLQTTTGAGGDFVLVLPEPGSYTILAQALGFSATGRNVDVAAGERVEIQLTLERLPVIAPYIEVVQETGYSSCDYMLLLFTGRIPEPCNTGQEARNEFVLTVAESWRFLVTEITWQSGFGNSETMRLFNSDDGDCASGSPCYGLVYGKRYARLEGEPGKTEIVSHYDPWEDDRGLPYPEGEFELHVNAQWIGLLVEEINTVPCGTLTSAATGSGYKPGCPGVGVSTGIPFEVWHSNFHWEPPEDLGGCCPATQYSALPDR